MSVSVFITGATGFIAQHTIKLLLEKGYNVVGTVRSQSKGELLQSHFGDKFTYEIVADIEPEGAFDEAFKKHPEVTVVLHTASPVSFQFDDPYEDMILPAVNGTKNALKSTKQFAPQVTRFVYTSSYAAVNDASRDLEPDSVINEDSWNPVAYEDAKDDGRKAYRISKTFAEKAAWDFVKNEKPNFTLATVNPTFVF